MSSQSSKEEDDDFSPKSATNDENSEFKELNKNESIENDKNDADMNDIHEDDNEPTPFAAALGLHRVGSVLPPKPQPKQPIQILNARGMPARIRKKNKLFFDDNIVNERPPRSSPLKKGGGGSTPNSSSKISIQSPIKTPNKILKKRRGVISRYMKIKEENRQRAAMKKQKVNEDTVAVVEITSPSQSQTNQQQHHQEEQKQQQQLQQQLENHSSHRRAFQKIGLRLRNLLKLPKAHKWVSYEWFYSYIDRPLFEGDNDFQNCLKELFPQLKTRMLTRIEWSNIRKLMGKPRRCSQAFFMEERAELEFRRNKIRLLQTRKSADAAFIKNMPAEIPLPLPIGTKVTARLRFPQDGLYTGSIDVVDSMSSSYRIAFDRPGLGSHMVPDFEVLANDFIETIPTVSLVHDMRPNNNSTGSGNLVRRSNAFLLSTNKHDPLLGSEIYNNSKLKGIMFPQETIGGFQLKLLELVIRTKKSIMAKKLKLLRLKNMNGEAEMYKSFNEAFPEDYQRRYASIVIGMEKLNRDIQEYLSQIQLNARDLAKEPILAAMLTPTYLREKCKELAVEAVTKNNQSIKDESMLHLITDLSKIMWVTSNMTNDDQNAHVMKVLEVCLEESKNRLDPENVEIFEKNVHVHMKHIEMDLCHSGQ